MSGEGRSSVAMAASGTVTRAFYDAKNRYVYRLAFRKCILMDHRQKSVGTTVIMI